MHMQERQTRASDFAAFLKEQGFLPKDFDSRLVEQIIITDLTHIDALAEVSPEGRPVYLSGVLDGFDLLLLNTVDLTGSVEQFEKVLKHSRLPALETAAIRKTMGAVLREWLDEYKQIHGEELVLQIDARDGCCYIAIPSELREGILACFSK
jgi:hypothetical protein